MLKRDLQTWIYDVQMLLITIAIAILIFGCAKPSVDPPISGESPEMTAPKAPRLLPKVELESNLPKLKNEDGSGRVDGHMVRLQKHLNRKVRIAGTVVFKSSTKWKNKRRTMPHLYIADANNLETDLKLLVVKIDEKQMRLFKQGKRYIFEGKLVKEVRSLGWKSERGMLALEKFESSPTQ